MLFKHEKGIICVIYFIIICLPEKMFCVDVELKWSNLNTDRDLFTR